MSFSRRIRSALTWGGPPFGVLVVVFRLGVVGASATPAPADGGVAAAPSVGSAAARPEAVLPPIPPPPENPVKKFRDLLGLGAAGREAALAGKTEWQQRYLRGLLAEFDALTSTEREVRLGLMQLRHAMLLLLRTPAAQRESQLAQMPAEDRELLAERLGAWERLPADQQQELLQNEAVLSQVLWFDARSAERQQAFLEAMPGTRRQEFEADLVRWRELPEAQRERLSRNFGQFFELSERQKQKALQRVTEPDRLKIERAMLALEKLPPEERVRCLEALNRFAAMTPAERNRFLQNAARWQAMSAEERQAWRRVAAHVAPGGRLAVRPPQPPPPMPRTGPPRAVPSSATNAQVPGSPNP